MDPIYTPANTKFAYQLRWSLALFRRIEIPPANTWLDQLRDVVERDAVRLLDHRSVAPATEQFLLSTTPAVVPHVIIKSVKGRLQNLLQAEVPKAFRRNYWLTTLGDVRSAEVEAYVANQLGHHRIADQRVGERLAEFQFSFPDVDLTEPQATAHGRFADNLHLVLVHDERFRAVERDWLVATRDMVLGAAKKKAHRLSRLALMPDHLHLTVGCGIEESPSSVALGYMNNIAYAHGMKRVFIWSCYVGSMGSYDMEAVRRCLEEE